MKANFCIILLLSVCYFGFSQSKMQLNVSKNRKATVGEKSTIQNLPAHLTVAQFILNKSIRNNEINKGDKILFNFENFQDKEAIVTYKSTDVNNVTSYICKFKEYQFAQAFISVGKDEYLISIDIPELNRKLGTYSAKNRQEYYLVELDTSNLDELQCNNALLKVQQDEHLMEDEKIPLHGKVPNKNKSVPKEKVPEQRLLNEGLGCNSLGEDDNATFKVLIVYTPAALAFAGSQAGMNNLIAQSITRANNASINSNLGMDFILAHSEAVMYEKASVAEGGSSTDLYRLRNKTDNFMDNVHALRDTYAADFVHLFSFISDTGGLGYILNTKYGQDNLGFALTRVQQLEFTDTFIHELGHNMGASHASGQNTQQGPTQWTNWPENTWSAGWRFLGNANKYYCSLMAYESGTYWPDGIGSVRISFFSSPLFTHQDQTIGNQVSADNARSLKAMKQIVSRYRDENTLQYCSASGSNASTLNLAITNINLNGLTNPSVWKSFSDFSYKSTCLIKGQTYPLTVNVGGVFNGAKLWVWVDWNNDLDFDDPDELILNSITGENLQYNVNIIPPPSAFIGPVRMRIRYESETSSPATSPCGIALFGEVEDYTIFVQEAITVQDTDGDGVADHSDLDSDNDGILDSVEMADGISEVDTDGDGIPNHLDLDADNDGIPDNVEAQSTVDYLPPANDTPATYLANNGVNSAYIAKPITPVDSDGDGIPDYLDTDSDNDGISDLMESFDPPPAGSTGVNGLMADAETADDYTDVNGRAYDATGFTLLDTDHDAANGADFDYRDIAETQPLSGTQIISSFISSTLVSATSAAYLTISAVNLGVVITRVNGASSVSNPVEGMIIYDTSDHTFKVNTTGTAAGWRAFEN